MAGLEPEDLVEAPGTFDTSHCISPLCRQEYTLGRMKGEESEVIYEGRPPAYCLLLSSRGQGLCSRTPVLSCTDVALLSLRWP